ncbi:hypothetical protein IMY05_C4628000500 [Salix suchowensis]|nr:hypothetical protein IMY05_C4628000500 [Salix suchowensis]
MRTLSLTLALYTNKQRLLSTKPSSIPPYSNLPFGSPQYPASRWHFADNAGAAICTITRKPCRTPNHALVYPLYHPIPCSYSNNSLASFSDEIPRLSSAHISPPLQGTSPPPHDPSNSLQNTADVSPGDELSYDDAVRQFKATKRQRRIAIKSKVTASSGASIQVVDGSSEFAPIFSEHDQMWYCNMCGKGIKRHGDVIRHWRSFNCPVRKAANRGAPKRLACPFPSCKYSTGRRDGLSRHLNVHRPGADS